MTSRTDPLSRRQLELLDAWLPGAEVVQDHSWGLVGATVLQVSHAGASYIVKAGRERDQHLATEHERRPDVYRQAGELLARLHGQCEVEDREFERREKDKALAWLDQPHRIPADVAERLRDEVASWPTPPVVVVPTHGDWQPRNWLVHQGVVSVIDLGRADLRPAMTDLARLAAQQFRTDPALEAAFLDGYGGDPREPAAWRRNRVREAIGTAVWAHQVGDEAFERQGHRMIAEAIGPWDR